MNAKRHCDYDGWGKFATPQEACAFFRAVFHDMCFKLLPKLRWAVYAPVLNGRGQVIKMTPVGHWTRPGRTGEFRVYAYACENDAYLAGEKYGPEGWRVKPWLSDDPCDEMAPIISANKSKFPWRPWVWGEDS
ncbi:MAG: hypothetical protein Unbinned1327contig1000_41 [Prokaryotic dsDNA virus sp.]|nr:MAG: hypothetical protein Unbinned1327contig1000_41 [Prokaryotic dsDNA virus sp.]